MENPVRNRRKVDMMESWRHAHDSEKPAKVRQMTGSSHIHQHSHEDLILEINPS